MVSRFKISGLKTRIKLNNCYESEYIAMINSIKQLGGKTKGVTLEKTIEVLNKL